MSVDSETNRLVKFILLLVALVPSLLCDVLIFTFLIRHWRREVLDTPQNHVILCLLVVGFIQKTIDVPSLLYYYHSHDIVLHNQRFCSMWNWVDYSFIIENVHLLMWCCIERHLFVFHSRLMRKRIYLILFHYIPLIIVLIYLPTFYASVMFLQSLCSDSWDYATILCGVPCYIYLPVLGSVDWLFHCATPIFIIVFFNVLLFCRFIWQKLKQQRPIRWNQQRRLIIQLVFISILFLMFLSPLIIVGTIQSLWIPDFLADIQYNIFSFLTYFPNQLLPVVLLSQLPAMRRELYLWMRNITRRYSQPTKIHPTHRTNDQSMIP